MSKNLLTDGFEILQRIPMEEVERRIKWLEESLASYKQIMLVKTLMLNRPELLQTPPEWEPLVEPPAPEPAPVPVERRDTRSENYRGFNSVEAVELYMREHGSAKMKRLHTAIGGSEAAIWAALKAGLGTKYERTGRGHYRYIGDQSPLPPNIRLSPLDARDQEEEERREQEKCIG